MSKALIVKLILYYASLNGVDGRTALAVVQVESNFNMSALGSQGEIGLFQVMPQYSKYTKEELKDPVNNIKEGIRIMKFAKDTCSHKKGNTYLVCYNYGKTNALKIKHPELFPYVKKVNAAMLAMK